jgi:16S rRNA (cytosine967-C5)-methyltransferase
MMTRTPRATAHPARDPARDVAVEVVRSVDVDGAYSNLLLPRLLRERGVSGRDAAFATELCYGTLRWQGVLDEVASAAAGRDVAALDPPVRAVVRLGVYQLLHMRTPPHAAVHATVELARATCGPRPVGLVNAVLRKVGTADWDGWTRRLAPADPVGGSAFRHGYPPWVAAAICAALGDSADELDDALAADRPVTHLLARPSRIDRDQLLAQAGPDAAPGPWSPYAVRMAGGDPARLSAVQHGLAGVQDEGSQLVALAAAQAPVADDAGRWLDMCAGPGGKAVLLEALLPAGGHLFAGDLQPHRAALVARAVGARTAVVVVDGRRPPWRFGVFDRVLLDAPCTGLGALRRRPEVRWRRTPADVPRLAALQRELLTSALASARPGGLVAYVTCSPHLEETRAVVAAALDDTSGVELVDARPLLPDVPGLGPGPDIQLWPHRHGTDAMYLALLRVGIAPSG